MNISRKHVFAVLTAAVLVASIFGAGCISTLNPLPHEVMVRENVIAVDPEYVPSSLIMSLLVNPNGYETSLFDALDEFLPRENPVIEVGAGLGVVSAYVNDRIFIKNEHIALEPNPYYTTLLKETKKINNLGTRFVQGAIYYESSLSPYVLAKNSDESSTAVYTSVYSSDSVTELQMEVQSLTLSEVIRDSSFVDKSNITLIVDADGVFEDILDNEPALRGSVSVIFATVLDDAEIFDIKRKAEAAGYTLVNMPTADDGGLTTLVLKGYNPHLFSCIDRFISCHAE